MSKENVVYDLKYNVIKSMVERCDQLNKDIKSFENEINNGNSFYENKLVELKNSSIKCYDDYWNLIIEMCKKDEGYKNAFDELMPKGQIEYIYRDIIKYFENKQDNASLIINKGIEMYNKFSGHNYKPSEEVVKIFAEILKSELSCYNIDILSKLSKL